MSDKKYWEVNEEDIEILVPEEEYQNDCFQFSKPVCELDDLEWAEIKRIAHECHKEGMYKRNQFKIAIEAFQRWVCLSTLNENLDEEIKVTTPKTFH